MICKLLALCDCNDNHTILPNVLYDKLGISLVKVLIFNTRHFSCPKSCGLIHNSKFFTSIVYLTLVYLYYLTINCPRYFHLRSLL